MSTPAAKLVADEARAADLERVLASEIDRPGSSPGSRIDSLLEVARTALDLRTVAIWDVRPEVAVCLHAAPRGADHLPPSGPVSAAAVDLDGSIARSLVVPIVGSDSLVLHCEASEDRTWSLQDRLSVRSLVGVVGGLLLRARLDAAHATAADALSRSRQVEELAGLGSWIWDVERDLVTWSDNLRRLAGAETEPAEIAFERFLGYVDPQDRESVSKTVAAALRGEQPFVLATRIRRQDGSVGWILVRALVERGADGNPIRVIGTTQDVTELRRTQEALRSSEARLRGLFMQFPFSVQILDTSGRTLMVNRAFEQFWGYGLEALENFNPLTEPQLEPLREAIKRGFAGETVFLPPVLFDGSRIDDRPDASGPRWVQAFLFPVRDTNGTLRELILVHQDVTQQKEAEEQLRVSEESYRTIFDLASDAIFVHHPVTGAVLDVNRQASEIHGMTVEELKAKGLDAIAGGDPFTRENAVEYIRKAAAGEPQTFEWLVYNGSDPVWVEVRLNRVTILGEDRVLANVRNIHQRKVAEEALRRANEELEARVAERTAELLTANEALSASVTEHQLARRELTRRTEEFEGIFHALPDLFFRLTPEGLILGHRSGNGQAWQLPPDLLDRNITELLPPEEAKLVADALAEVARTGRLSIVEYALAHDGCECEYEARILPLRDGSLIAIVRDITARKKAERALQQREEHFRTLIENAHDLVQVLDSQGRVSYTGPSVEHLLGYTPAELVGSDPLELIDPADRDRIRAAIAEILVEPGAVRSEQYRIRHKDGSWRVFEAFGRSILSDSGEPELVVNARDVTERIQMEDAIRDSEEHFRRLIENAHDMVVIVDSRGLLQYGSPSVRRILGYDPEGLKDRDSTEFIHPDDVPAVREQLARMARDPSTPARIECRFRHSDGSWRNLEAVGSSLAPDDARAGFVFNVRDVTERHAAEDALRRREEHFRSLIENAHDITCICSSDGTMLYQSPSLERRLGYPPEELIGRSAFPYVHPEDVPATRDALERMIAEPGSVVRLEYRFRHRDGSWRMLEAFGRTLLQDSAAEGVVFNVRDVTERMMAERALATAKEEAERAREAAERANRAKSEFLSRMSHELRTPMNSILGFGQLLERADLAPDQHRGVQHILRAGRHLLHLINEVLEIARIEAGRQNFSIEPVRLRGAVLEAVGLVRPLAAQRGIILDDGPWENGERFVQADRQRLVQVLLNLLSNAVKYNREGGRVSVSIEVAEGPEGERLVLRVTDTGHGIPADRQDELFTPFARLGAEQTDVEGTGLGLALSQRLVVAMGGSLTLESSGPEGSVFRLDLASAEDPAIRIEESTDSEPRNLEVEHEEATILYIEDNLANLSLVESILEARPKWRTVPALQGRLGIDLARQHRPDLVLLDLHLPDVPGEEVMRRLKEDPATGAIPIVIITADATRSSQQRLELAGADAYLTKPLDVDLFLSTLDRFLGTHG